MKHKLGRRGIHIAYWWEIRKEGDSWEDQDVGGCTILKRILKEMGWGSMGWIDLAKDRDQRIAFVSTLMNLRAP
jgi:hypothetical protein